MSALDLPLETYTQRLKQAHYQTVCDTLEALIQRSGVDVEANRQTVKELKSASATLEKAQKRLRRLQGLSVFLKLLLWVGGGVVGLFLLNQCSDTPQVEDGSILFFAFLVLIGALFWLLFGVNPALADAQRVCSTLEHHWKELQILAWKQMKPLNRLFTWETVTDLLRKTLPEIHFDRTFAQARFADLIQAFGWNPDWMERISVRQLQSGDINGNPFVMVEGMMSKMGERTYTGSRTVAVKKRVYLDGRMRTVTAHECLTATITRPYPEYHPVSFLLFGSNVAPNLSFSREPSKHSGKEDTFFNRWAKRRTTKKLEAFSRNLDDEYGFTLMANREFETLFHATDRSDEREFRLLFTPSAQHEMVKLLNDTKVGFGDNFRMDKEGGITLLFPQHLHQTDLRLNPGHFCHDDIDALKEHFIQFNAAYFKAFYFALAPLLVIPLYTQRRLQQDAIKQWSASGTAAWENELIANAYGEDFFKAESCVTPCILKAETQKSGSVTQFNVVAHGYTMRQRVATVPASDSNGDSHLVSVPWDEFLPITQIHSMVALPDCAEDGSALTREAAQAAFETRGIKVRELRHVRASYTAFAE